MKKLNELSQAELNQLIENPQSNEKVYDFSNDIVDFIKAYSLEAGENRVQGKLLYKLYKKYSKNSMSLIVFIHNLTDIFSSVRYGKGMMFCLNKPALDYKIEVFKQKEIVRTKFKVKGWKSHVDNYLNHFNIKSGLLAIKSTVLYTLYRDFCKEVRRKPLTLLEFINFLKIQFTYKKTKNAYWFYVDRSIEQYLTEEMIEEMKKNGPKKENP